MIRLLLLGHHGMLGHTVYDYFTAKPDTYTVTVTEERWDIAYFRATLKNSIADFVINCIGKIPQKKPTDDTLYTALNFDLPVFLETTGKRIIHPSTDCEFSGTLLPGSAYTKNSPRDATDAYGHSKALISKKIEDEFTNTKIIRTSIIGHEYHTNLSLLDWFLSQSGSVHGYTNHYWNGVTTLEWTKQCARLMEYWVDRPTLNQFGTEHYYSKYDVLNIIKNVYKKDTVIEPFETEQTVNKCLISDSKIPSLEEQLAELRIFFKNKPIKI